MDQIFIRDLVARGVIGVEQAERIKPQEIVINIVLFVDTRQAGQTDKITDGVSYSSVAKRVLAHAESIQRHTVEALAADIAGLCLAFPGVEKVQVQVEKPAAVRFARSAGVLIERSQCG